MWSDPGFKQNGDGVTVTDGVTSIFLMHCGGEMLQGLLKS